MLHTGADQQNDKTALLHSGEEQKNNIAELFRTKAEIEHTRANYYNYKTLHIYDRAMLFYRGAILRYKITNLS